MSALKILVSSLIDIKKSLHETIHEYLRYLSKRHEIAIISINDEWKTKWSHGAQAKEAKLWLGGVRVEYVTGKGISPLLQDIFPFERAVGMIRENFDVHLNYNSLGLGYRIAKMVQKRGIKTVYNLVDNVAEMIRSSPRLPRLLRSIGAVMAERIIRQNIQIAEKVVYTTDSLKAHFSIPSTRAVLIPNGVDTEQFKPFHDTKLKGSLGFDKYFTICYVGVLREWVDLEPIFKALKSLRMVAAVVVGAEGGLEKQKRLTRKYGVSKRVAFVGAVPYADVPRYISMSDICVIPFKHSSVTNYAMPLKLLEYMACGKPVVSTPIQPIVEAVGDMVLYAARPKQYITQITKLFRNEPLRVKLGVDGKRLVEERYSWNSVVSQLEEVLETVACKKS